MKKLLTALLALYMLLSLAACGGPTRVRDFDDEPGFTAKETVSTPTTEAQTATLPTAEPAGESQITPLLYKVSDGSGNVVWLFGSIHVGQEHYYPLPQYVLSAYEGADALAVECDVVSFSSDLGAQTDALMQLLYLDGTRISDHLSEALYTRAVEVMEECGVYMSALDMYYPILWSSFIDSALYEQMDADSQLGIDMHLLSRAHETGKEILEVESVEFQYGLMGNFSEELQILLLENSIYSYEHPEETEAELTGLMNAWAAGDRTQLAALLSEETELESEEEELLYQEYTNAMIVERNLSMADYAEAALQSDKEVFICVGAAHIVGEGAMADLLAQRGYTVETVTP